MQLQRGGSIIRPTIMVRQRRW